MGSPFSKRDKLIFIDVDGVLNSEKTRLRNLSAIESAIHSENLPPIDMPDNNLVGLFADIVHKTKAKVILSSTWRLEEENFDIIRLCLKKHGVKIFAATPNFENLHVDNSRPDEIVDFILKYSDTYGRKVASWVAIDDMPLLQMASIGRKSAPATTIFTAKHFVKTSDATGLTRVNAKEAIEKLMNVENK